ncbi:MAG: glycosyltransferase family 39 protein [Candidatus Acidiferrales bacterium]
MYWLLGLLLLYVVVKGLMNAAARSLSFDELLTMAVASQPGPKGIWDALAHAVDGQPPLFYWVERLAMGLASNKQVALRLPSILGMVCSMAFTFVYLKRRSGELIAFLCASFLMSTCLFSIFTSNARPYSLLIACITFALVCYQRATSPVWTALLGISLALAESFHYYAIFAMIPFGLAEVVVFCRTSRFRWSVWIALAFGALPLIFWWPLLAHLKAYYGSHFWARYGLSSLPKTYGVFLLTDAAYGSAFVAVLFVTVLFGSVVGSRLLSRWVKFSRVEIRKSDQVEGVLILGLMALPLIAFAVTKVVHGAMRDVHALGAVIGICLALGCLLSGARPVAVALFALFVFSAVGIHEVSFWRAYRSPHPESAATSVQEFVQTASYPDLPVVVSGLPYLTINYYASPAWSKRFIFLTDENLEAKYLGNDNMDKNFAVLRPYMPIHVSDFSEFTSSHAEFLLYAEDPGAGFDWLPYHLSRDPWSLQVLARDPSRVLYLVRMKNAVPAN